MDSIQTTLLIVEDDERTVEELTRILKKHTSFKIISTPSPSKALKIAEEEKIEIALLDLKLPEMSGLELVIHLKKNNPDLLVTIMTGYGEEDTPIIAKEKGVVDFIEKPINLKYLLATLKFQEREALIRRTLRNAADLLQKFFSMTEDGVVMTNGKEILLSNPKGMELYSKYKESLEKKIKIDEKHYEHIVSQSGSILFHHFRDITLALETSKSETRIEMARIIAHELHNSLTPIKLWLQEILALKSDDETFVETAKKAASEGTLQIKRLVNLTRRFKILANDSPLLLEKIKIKQIISKLISSLEPMLKEKEINVKVDIDDGLEVLASEVDFYQILYNLILNSIEAFKEKRGNINITAQTMEDVLITISDNAGGLPDEIAETPFSPYLTTKEGGSGIGLVLSKEMAKRMNGELTLVNKKGIGLEITLKLKKA